MKVGDKFSTANGKYIATINRLTNDRVFYTWDDGYDKVEKITYLRADFDSGYYRLLTPLLMALL